MRVHHLNCGSLAEIEPVDGDGAPMRAVCHCLLIETDSDGLVLVESGIGTYDIAHPAETLGEEWTAFAAPVLDVEETAVRQVARLGYDPADVRHVALTHLHQDHAGGLRDFPRARVHVRAAELDATPRDNPQLAHGPDWVTYADGGETWFGFAGVRGLEGVSADVLMVPLGGHSPGHAGVAVNDGGRWLVHAGDAYFHHAEIDRPEPRTHPLMELVQANAETDRDLRLANVDRLRTLVLANALDTISAHDPWQIQPHVVASGA
ncbi:MULTISPECIES: MBL fold metallo-hydrolase [Actinomadura]|uniref:MBL fold metallo-hydrolase n=1 Tax=Actinomadura yumaensis TaxID=111807 RepID=A0ABW2CL58_9ACTN|nr:MBL fold metallo-hydrolase [Actinomadura sp. J1-007]MWK38818.1 MBL fold metallo-hydrolase [Actinomadura sp. J1-007]